MSVKNMLTAAGLCGLTLTSGCTFCLLDGNGLVSRSSVVARLPKANASEIAQWKGEVETMPIKRNLGAAGVYKDYGYTVDYASSYNWTVLCGPLKTRTLHTPRDEGRRTILEAANLWGFSSPLFLTGEGREVDVETGECLSSDNSMSLTPLFIHMSSVKPAKPDKKTPGHLSKEKNLDEVKYDKSSGVCIGLGLLAWGQKNNRAYFQIAWIPIPLWSLE